MPEKIFSSVAIFWSEGRSSAFFRKYFRISLSVSGTRFICMFSSVSRVEALRQYDKAIVCNEDQKVGEEAARACEASVNAGCSWGLMLEKLNQNVPFEFKGHEDDVVVYAKVKELTTAAQ